MEFHNIFFYVLNYLINFKPLIDACKCKMYNCLLMLLKSTAFCGCLCHNCIIFSFAIWPIGCCTTERQYYSAHPNLQSYLFNKICLLVFLCCLCSWTRYSHRSILAGWLSWFSVPVPNSRLQPTLFMLWSSSYAINVCQRCEVVCSSRSWLLVDPHNHPDCSS